jgi:hypothetical protein
MDDGKVVECRGVIGEAPISVLALRMEAASWRARIRPFLTTRTLTVRPASWTT